MNTLPPVSQPKLITWPQHGKAAKQWLGHFTARLDWLNAYKMSQKRSFHWLETNPVKLQDTPLFGSYLAELTESLMTEKPTREHTVNSKKLVTYGNKPENRRGDKEPIQQRRKLRQTPSSPAHQVHQRKAMRQIEQPGRSRVSKKTVRQAEPSEAAETASLTKRLQPQAAYAALRQWSDTPLPVKTSDHTAAVYSLPDYLHRERQSGVNIARAETASMNEKQQAKNPLQRVKKMLHKNIQKTDRNGMTDTINTKRFKAINRDFLLAEQWQSVLQGPQLSHEQLMKIVTEATQVSKISRDNEQDDVMSPGFKGKHGREDVIGQPLKATSSRSQQSAGRSHKSSQVAHGEMQPGPSYQQSPAFQNESFALQKQTPIATSSDSDPLKTAENQDTENLLGGTQNKPIEIAQDDDALALQIKRILDEEARRYGIDI